MCDYHGSEVYVVSVRIMTTSNCELIKAKFFNSAKKLCYHFLFIEYFFL